MNRHVRIRLLAGAAMAAVSIPALSAQERPPLPQPLRVRDMARELACGPQSPLVAPDQSIKVLTGKDLNKTLWGTGEVLVINAGDNQGVKTGQEYYLRRNVKDKYTEMKPGVNPVSVHTVGWVKITETQADTSVALITHGCDGVMEGDYLEPFQQLVVPAALGGEADFAHPGSIILGDERRQVGGAGEMMVLDRGSDHGIRPGQQLTIFRQPVGSSGPVFKIGTATVITVRPESCTFRIDTASDAVYVGNLVAVHR